MVSLIPRRTYKSTTVTYHRSLLCYEQLIHAFVSKGNLAVYFMQAATAEASFKALGSSAGSQAPPELQLLLKRFPSSSISQKLFTLTFCPPKSRSYSISIRNPGLTSSRLKLTFVYSTVLFFVRYIYHIVINIINWLTLGLGLSHSYR